MTDLVARLRSFYSHAGPVAGLLPIEAADEIERLRAALTQANAAMTQALTYADAVESDGHAEHWTRPDKDAEVSWSQVRKSIDFATGALKPNYVITESP